MNKKMDDDENQCCAVNDNNKRCQKSAIHGTYHCQEHFVMARKLYKKYKKICDIAYNLDIEKRFSDITKQVNHVMNCYVWLNKAFDARMTHRKYAFVPECYDKGHDLQFVLITEKIIKCEEILTKLFTKHQNENIKLLKNSSETNNEDSQSYDLSEDSTSSDDSNNGAGLYNNYDITNVPKDIRRLNEMRKETEEDVNKKIEMYISENRVLLEKRRILKTLIINCVRQLIPKKYTSTSKNIFLFCVGIHHLVRHLYNNNYFSDDYEPDRCKDCNCNNFVGYEIKLSCKCIESKLIYGDDVEYTAYEYFELLNDFTLRKFYELLLKNTKKIKPLVDDMIYLYYFYEKNLLKIDLELEWDDELKRLKLVQLLDKPNERGSRYLALFRLKKKLFLKKYEEEYSSEEDDDEIGEMTKMITN